MKNSEIIIAQKIKEILIQMAIDSSLPMDMNELDMNDIYIQATNDESVKNQRMLESASSILNYDDCSDLMDAVNTLLGLEKNGQGSEIGSFHVDTWQGVEDMTVDDLIALMDV